jgi:sugar lactone lactonase YvrE
VSSAFRIRYLEVRNPQSPVAVALVLMLPIVCLLAAAGCGRSLGRQAPEFGPSYPPAPNVARVQYLRSFSGGSDFRQPGGGFWRRLFGGSSQAGGDLVKPYGLAAAEGRLYVCDTSRGDVFTFDFARGSFDRWEHPDQDLVKPIAVRIADSGEVQVCDVGLGAVLTFSAGGKLLGSVSLATLQETTPSAALPAALRPVGLADGPGQTTAILNAASHRVELIDLETGHHDGSWSGPGSDVGRLYYPTAMAQDHDGTLWIADRVNRRVLALGRDGQMQAGFGDAGDQPGYLSQPRGIAVDGRGVIYLVDAGLPGIQLFDRNGEFLMGFGYPGDAGCEMRLPAGVCLDRSSLPYFADLIRPDFEAQYLIFVSDQMGPDRVHVYAFGRGTSSTPVAAGRPAGR